MTINSTLYFMKQFFLGCLFIISSPILIFGQSIFENSITGVNPNMSNPYTIGQAVDSNITVSGIGMGSGLFGLDTNDRYNARSWGLSGLDPDSYFEFTITPNTDRKIDFVSFVYTGQISVNGPILFAFRSSVDGFTTNIGSVTATGTTVSLSAAAFQDIVTPITFRLYGWAAIAGTGTFSINDFQFNGIVSCTTPQIPTLPETSLSCSSTSFELNWPASMHTSNYFIDVATDSGFMNSLTGYQNKVLGNTLLETVTGLNAGGTYYVRLQAANSCATSGYSNSIKVAPPETIYTGTWSNGIPDGNKNVRFSDDFNVNASFEACSCQIDDGVVVQVDSDGVLKLQNGLDIQGDGTLTFENNASLIQMNDAAVNFGKIIYKRNSMPMKNFDFTRWSSPVEGQMLNVLSPNTLRDKYYSFEKGNWITIFDGNALMRAGYGYSIRVPKPQFWSVPTDPTYVQTAIFKGTPNNGVIKVESQGESQYNLIGNPYPSAIDADLFMANVNNALVIGGALYFWTHNTAISQSGSSYVYNPDDYAMYNLTGGTVAHSGGEKPDGNIAACQSFFVRSKAIGDFEFNNSMRISASGSNSQFFKMTKEKNLKKAEKSRVWLNLTNSQGAFKQLLVGYIKGASNEIDNLYDGVSFGGNKYIDFYSVNNGTNLSIQGREWPFLPTDKVSLGFKTTIDGTFEIKIAQVEGLLAMHNIYLEDKNTGVLHDLKKSPYSFSTPKGQYNNRFALRYLPNIKSVLDKNTKKQLEISTNEEQLTLKSTIGNISSIVIYDLKGQLIYQKNNIDKGLFVITDLIPTHQILIVKTVFDNGVSQTDKIIF